jgi:dipeptidyl aminopeptidase/acylaminoacyl peptidase
MRHVLAACVLSALPATALGAAEPIVTSDLLRIRTVTSIDVSGDGGRAVVAVRSIEPLPAPAAAPEARGAAGTRGAAETPPKYAYRSHLFMIDVLDPQAQLRQLTFGDRLDCDAALSPDGRRIAFTRGEADDGRGAQVWVLRADGGEARQVTDLPGGVEGAPVWSPDGRRILVRSMVSIDDLDGAPPWPSERPGREWNDAGDARGAGPDGTLAEVRAWLAGNEARQDPAVITRLSYQDDTKLEGPLRFSHLFLVDPDAAERSATRVTDGFFDHHEPAFMPDGRTIVYAARKETGVHPDRGIGTDIWRVGVDGSGDGRLLWIDGWSLERPLPSRDGNLIALLGQQLDEPGYRPQVLGIASAEGRSGGEPVWLTGEGILDASVRDFRWVPGRAALLFTAGVRGAVPLMTTSPGLLEPAELAGRLDGQPIAVQALAAGGSTVVYAASAASSPAVLRVRDLRGDRALVDLNAWAGSKALSVPAEGWITRPDGTRVQYWVMAPAGREARKRYPLAVQVHGGPAAMWGPAEHTMWHEFQLLCSRGYGVAYCNPRGSDGYGYEFTRGNYRDWGEGPAGDVLAMADQAALADWVDPGRLVLTGGSYGGYLTAWIVAHDRRFRAAVAQRGVYDLATFFGEGNAWRLVEWSMGGYPFDSRFRAIIDRNSPFTYAGRIETPLLIMHSGDDLRTGVSQSEMLYRALKVAGRPVEYVRYPGGGHELSRSGDPAARMDRLNRIIEFFDRCAGRP